MRVVDAVTAGRVVTWMNSAESVFCIIHPGELFFAWAKPEIWSIAWASCWASLGVPATLIYIFNCFLIDCKWFSRVPWNPCMCVDPLVSKNEDLIDSNGFSHWCWLIIGYFQRKIHNVCLWIKRDNLRNFERVRSNHKWT